MDLFSPSRFNPHLLQTASACEQSLAARFLEIARVAGYNSQKVHEAFRACSVSESHFVATTGYGYDDRGREVIDRVFATAFDAEDALVRHSLLSGTQAIAAVLFSLLRPGDHLLSLTATPYDTLKKVIGIVPAEGSLSEFGIGFSQVEMPDGKLDFDAIERELAARRPKAAYLQRSRGYSSRDSVFVQEIAQAAELVHHVCPDCVMCVDNCYGEFVERQEPTSAGADIMAGSLIKNPGGSIAPCGGYIAGRAALVERCAGRLSTPGAGRGVGPSLGHNRALLQGFYLAPGITGEALKTAAFTAALFESLGFSCSPGAQQPRTDLVQQIILHEPHLLTAFCQGIQEGSAIDSFVRPEPWAMPGYSDEIIMAAGAFVQGASIELSADGPLRPPYAAYIQGGIRYESAVIAVLTAAQALLLAKEKSGAAC